MCDDAIEAFMRGNFNKFERINDKLENIKTQTIRNLLTREE